MIDISIPKVIVDEKKAIIHRDKARVEGSSLVRLMMESCTFKWQKKKVGGRRQLESRQAGVIKLVFTV